MRRSIPAFATGFLLLLGPGTTSAQIKTGVEALQRADFESARAAFETELESPAATQTTLVDAYRHLALVYMAIGDKKGATSNMGAALSLDPHIPPPAGAGSAFITTFESIRKEVAKLPLSLKVELDESRRVVKAQVEGIEPALALDLDLLCEVNETRLAPRHEHIAPPRHEMNLILPIGAHGSLSCEAALTTQKGARIVSEQLDATVGNPPNPQGAHEPSRSGLELERPARHERKRTGLWIGIGVGVAAIGAAVAAGVLLSRRDHAELGPVMVPVTAP